MKQLLNCKETETRQRIVRVVMAVLIAAAAGMYVLVIYGRQPDAVSDWDAIWAGATALRHGGSPYAAIDPVRWGWTLRYPMPAIVVVLPFTWLPLAAARVIFVAGSAGLLAYVLASRGTWRLYLLGTSAMYTAVRNVQWVPLLVAIALLSEQRAALRVCGALFSVKPTTGGALWVRKPNWAAVLGGIGIVVLSFLAYPGWLTEWLAALHGIPHKPPLLRPGGFILLLAALRWRDANAWLILILALAPQTTAPYEYLPLILIAQTRKEAVFLGSFGLAAGVVGHFTVPNGPWPVGAEQQWWIALLFYYGPALTLLLRRQRGAAPSNEKTASPILSGPPVDRVVADSIAPGVG